MYSCFLLYVRVLNTNTKQSTLEILHILFSFSTNIFIRLKKLSGSFLICVFLYAGMSIGKKYYCIQQLPLYVNVILLQILTYACSDCHVNVSLAQYPPGFSAQFKPDRSHWTHLGQGFTAQVVSTRLIN